MASNVYEGMFLLDSNRYARDPNVVSKQINQIVADCGGEMLASRLWSEQKLAYPIDGHRKGTYWLTYFRMDSLKQVDLNRACKLNENVLRNMIIKIDDRLVDTLVEHAKGITASAAPAAAAPTTPAAAAPTTPAAAAPTTPAAAAPTTPAAAAPTTPAAAAPTTPAAAAPTTPAAAEEIPVEEGGENAEDEQAG